MGVVACLSLSGSREGGGVGWALIRGCALINFLPLGWALIRGGRLFEAGRLFE